MTTGDTPGSPALHHVLASLAEDHGSSVFDDADAFRGALDDYLDEGAASAGTINLLADAVRLGVIRGMTTALEAGAGVEATVDEAGRRLARDRGTDDVDGSRWACVVLGYACGLVPESVVTSTRPSTSPGAAPPSRPSAPTMSPGTPPQVWPATPHGYAFPSGSPAPGRQPRPTADGISIAGFVLSLLCCTAPLGLVLGIAGLVRTRKGRRTGRWAAVSAIVIALLVIGPTTAFVAYVGIHNRTLDAVEAGTCIDLGFWSDQDDDDVWTVDCGDPHDAEIVHQGRIDAELLSAYRETDEDAFCRSLLERDVRRLVPAERFDLRVITETAGVGEASDGDHFVCYAERRDAEQLDEPLM